MLTEEAKKAIKEVMKRYKTKRAAVMPALTIAQDDVREVTAEDMLEIAEMLEIQPVIVNEVAKFYTMYNVQRKVGKYHIEVCHNISCNLLQAERIIAHIENRLNIKVGGTTTDGKFTLSTAECLGSCGTAPMMQINDTYYEDLTETKVNDILATLKSRD